ncbi:ABC transporter permease [Chondrinema litorale]|uniref:ABC transporter permease n=1 Tax=Chondrinema litorale TaxID=2994555 RepID=UPI002542B623|nr:ABC transporter permease subunit [Chondrinema litorale]UZR97918.1 ABC transporter permease subunit [Chondrinema litorale]
MKRIAYIIVIVSLLMPLVTIISLSVTVQWQYPQLWDAHFSLKNWLEAFTNNDVLSGLMLSLVIAVLIASIATSFGFIVSGFITENKKTEQLLQLAYYPYLIAPVVFGAMLQFYFAWLKLTGMLTGVILAQMIFILPYSVLFLATFWNNRIRQTAFQASSLGASNWHVYRTVLIPMARPWLFICFAQCFLISWFEYGITQVTGIGKVKTLTILTMQFVKEANPHLAGVVACLLVFPPLLLLAFNQRVFLKQSNFS